MKTCVILLLALLTLLTGISAQAPQGLNYQAVAYNSSGMPATNQAVSVRLSILDGSATGTTVYAETQNPTTDNTGLFSIVIGNGTVVSGTFNTISWGNGSKWLKTEIDITGGTSYLVMGTSQFMSVPYALYANTGGVGSPSFTNPDGFNHATTVVIDDSVNYTVPAGKNLYIPSAMWGVSIDGDTLGTSLSSTVADPKVFLGASENSVVWIRYFPRVCFLVDKKVEWKTVNLLTTSFTVPLNKQFVIVNAVTYYAGYPIPQTPGCNLLLNGLSYNYDNFFKVPMLMNSILDEGMTLSTSGCFGYYVFVINGYLKDK